MFPVLCSLRLEKNMLSIKYWIENNLHLRTASVLHICPMWFINLYTVYYWCWWRDWIRNVPGHSFTAKETGFHEESHLPTSAGSLLTAVVHQRADPGCQWMKGGVQGQHPPDPSSPDVDQRLCLCGTMASRSSITYHHHHHVLVHNMTDLCHLGNRPQI